jgi:hypothetical protein
MFPSRWLFGFAAIGLVPSLLMTAFAPGFQRTWVDVGASIGLDVTFVLMLAMIWRVTRGWTILNIDEDAVQAALEAAAARRGQALELRVSSVRVGGGRVDLAVFFQDGLRTAGVSLKKGDAAAYEALVADLRTEVAALPAAPGASFLEWIYLAMGVMFLGLIGVLGIS